MKLLIVDDEVVTTQVLEKKLDRERLGLTEVYSAYSVAMAEEILQRERVDIILCDVEMPQANGIELLEWVRRNEQEAEFLFLTSHEKFEYIFEAMQQGAASYLLKPIDIPKIQQALFQVEEKIRKQRQLNEVQEYWNYGRRRILKAFWRNIVFGEIVGQEEIRREIEKQGLKDDVGESYTLILFLFRKEAIFKKEDPQGLDLFIIDNILAEALTDRFEMANCVHWEEDGQYNVIVVSEYGKKEVAGKIGEIKAVLGRYYDQPVRAVYLSDEGGIDRLGAYREQMAAYAVSHIYENGEVFLFGEIEEDGKKLGHILDPKFVLQCFEKGERVKLLEHLQKSIVNLQKKDSDRIYLEYFQMDLLQIVGAYLNKHETDAEFLFMDEGYKAMWLKSRFSTFDMIQWSTYYVNRIFDSIQDREKGKSVVDTMLDYIHRHYEENINRNTLAEVVSFSPEYVGKLFKKAMGIGISEYINKLRIEKAKKLLETTDYKVIDIALMIGYDNMPYFSSVFKKYVGVSPAEYKKQ